MNDVNAATVKKGSLSALKAGCQTSRCGVLKMIHGLVDLFFDLIFTDLHHILILHFREAKFLYGCFLDNIYKCYFFDRK